jgi:hypothetical protein
MVKQLALVLGLIVLGTFDAIPAASNPDVSAVPAFSAAHRLAIAGNAFPSTAIKQDPQPLRHSLNDVAATPSNDMPANAVWSNATGRSAAKGAPTLAPGHAGRNPDLDDLQRKSPEAAYDLLQLLKRAAQKRK